MDISIVTVCYNAQEDIVETIESILAQTDLANCEYIIKDALSTDRTVKIAESYSAVFTDRKINFQLFQARDNGIYAAMNQSISLCSGEWVLFLNAGDKLYDNTVIERIKKYLQQIPSVIGMVYGNAAVVLENGEIIQVQCNHELLAYRSSICHQACFTQRKYLEKFGFDESFKILSDRDLFLRMTEQNIPFYKLDILVCTYRRGGASNNSFRKNFLEEKKLEEKHHFQVARGKYWKRYMMSCLKDIMVKTFPWMADWAYKWKNRKK